MMATADGDQCSRITAAEFSLVRVRTGVVRNGREDRALQSVGRARKNDSQFIIDDASCDSDCVAKIWQIGATRDRSSSPRLGGIAISQKETQLRRACKFVNTRHG